MNENDEFDSEKFLSELSAEDIHDIIAEALNEFKALVDSEDLSDETLDRMTVLAEVVEDLSDRHDALLRAFNLRESLTARVTSLF